MKYIIHTVLAVLGLGFVTVARAGDEIDMKLTQKVADILSECQKIAPGTTRVELLKLFATEGGLSTAKRRTFVHRHCPYIKIDVEFTLSSQKQDILDEQSGDTVSKVSRPYLQLSIGD